MTARNWQEDARKNGEPWTIAKGCDTFTPISSFIECNLIRNVSNCGVSLKLNGKQVQNGKISDMVFKIPTLIEYISDKMTLEEGDLILTGTPEGVGEFKHGDMLEGSLTENSVPLANFKFYASRDS